MADKIFESKPQSIKLTDAENGDQYFLDYTRATCVFVNNLGFDFEKIASNPEQMIPLLFYGAFRKNHKKVSKDFTDKLIDRMHGIPKKMFDRLVELYLSGRESLVCDDEDYDEKNSGVTVEL